MHRPFPKNCPFPWGIWTPRNTWFFGHTRVLNLNCISIGSAVFGDRQTDRPTDHATRSTCITIGGIYVRTTALRPKTNASWSQSHTMMLAANLLAAGNAWRHNPICDGSDAHGKQLALDKNKSSVKAWRVFVVFTRTTLASTGFNCRRVSVCPSVACRSFTEMA